MIAGRIRHGTPACAESSRTSRTRDPGAVGIVIKTSSTRSSATTRGRSSIVPSTGSRASTSFCFTGSSSRNPTGSIRSRGCWRKSRTSWAPARPAPTRRARRGFHPPGVVRRIRRSTASRTISRPDPMSSTATIPSISGTVLGNPVSPAWIPRPIPNRTSVPRATTSAMWRRSGTVVCCQEWRSSLPQTIATDFTRTPMPRYRAMTSALGHWTGSRSRKANSPATTHAARSAVNLKTTRPRGVRCMNGSDSRGTATA